MKLTRIDSRARASISHQVLKEESSSLGSSLDQLKMGKKIFKRRVSRRLEFIFVSLRFCFRKNIKDRLVVDCSSSFTHTKFI